VQPFTLVNCLCAMLAETCRDEGNPLPIFAYFRRPTLL
jgi:hypothetical protein